MTQAMINQIIGLHVLTVKLNCFNIWNMLGGMLQLVSALACYNVNDWKHSNTLLGNIISQAVKYYISWFLTANSSDLSPKV